MTEKKVADLARQKQRARRRGDPNFFRISKEHKAAKKLLEAKRKLLRELEENGQ